MLTVIGCGNSNRSDDGVGVFIAQSLLAYVSRQGRKDVRVFDAGTSGVEVMYQARGARQLIIVDAAKSGAQPGAIFKVPGEELTIDVEPVLGLHSFRWDHAIAAGRRIFRDQFPDDVTVYLIESLSLDFGLELTAPVRESAQKVISEIQRIIDAYCSGP